jgi:hypothetical protein
MNQTISAPMSSNYKRPAHPPNPPTGTTTTVGRPRGSSTSSGNVGAKLLQKRQSIHAAGGGGERSASDVVPPVPSMPLRLDTRVTPQDTQQFMTTDQTSGALDDNVALRETGLNLEMLASEDFNPEECTLLRILSQSILIA